MKDSGKLQEIVRYLAVSSESARDNFHLTRLARRAELRREFMGLLDQMVAASAEARAVGLIRRMLKAGKVVVNVEAPRIEPARLPAESGFDDSLQLRSQATALQRTRNGTESRRWSEYFIRFGCRVCASKTALHDAFGLCGKCYWRDRWRMRQVEKLLKVVEP